MSKKQEKPQAEASFEDGVLSIDINVSGVSESEQGDIAAAVNVAVSEAKRAVEAEFAEQVRLKDAEIKLLEGRLAEAETARAEAETKLAEQKRSTAYGALFDKYAVPMEDRAELLETFDGIKPEKAEALLQRFNPRVGKKPLAEGDTEDTADQDVPEVVDASEAESPLKIEELGREYAAENWLPKTGSSN